MGTVGRTLLYWFLGTIVSTAVVLCVWVVGTLAATSVIAVACGLSVVPLLLARRWPQVGGFTACSMLAAAPLAFLLAAKAANAPLVVSHWRCGTGDAAMLMLLPFAQAIVTLPVLALWAGRRSLAAVWRPAALGLMASVMVLALIGLVRSATLGPPTATFEPHLSLPTEFERAQVDGLIVRRECGPDSPECTLTVSTPGRKDPLIVHGRWAPKGRITIASIGDIRIIGQRPTVVSAGRRFAYNLTTGRLVDIRASDLPGRFGPTHGTFILAMLGLLAVGISARVRPTACLVWRRLGARGPRGYDRCDEILSLRVAHVAVALTVGLPLLASACIGLLG